jgi:hypothetical protein
MAKRSIGDLRVSLGFCVKSGWAAAVALSGSAIAVQVASHSVVQMSDPADPETKQPYHRDRGLLETDASVIVHRTEKVRQIAGQSLSQLLSVLSGRNLTPSGAVVVGGSKTSPDEIHSTHIRAHALEGRLFVQTLMVELSNQRIDAITITERDLWAKASELIQKNPEELKQMLVRLGAGRKPWGKEQKMAALGAWLSLVEAPQG